MKLDLILALGNKFGNLFVFAFILSRLKSFRNLVSEKSVKLGDKLLLSLIFGLFGIVGTYFSIEFNGALINTRIIGVATGGLLGGPFVGLMSGIVAGVHRGMINTGEFTSTACAISTVFEGLMAGYMGRFIQNKNKKWVYAAFTGVIAESMRKVSVLIFCKPFAKALELVKDIWIPMVIINSVGLALLFMIIENVFREREKMGAYQANVTLKIADKALPFLKQGIYSDSIEEAIRTVYEITEFNAVSITDKEKIITYIGLNDEIQNMINDSISKNDKYVINTGQTLIINDCSKSECNNVNCPHNSLIILPLKENNEIIGSLKLYKKSPNSITTIDLEIGNGLAKLFSTQLTLSKLEHNSKLLASAELRALQAQINPHFLFNSLTVIASLCRVNPEKARNLIIHLSNFFRKNLNLNKDLVELDVEINHIKSYVEIELARFEDKLKIIYDIEDNLTCLLPPLTLQPIVENAIKHGILPKKNGGIVKISGRRNGNEVNITIYDNGVGMSEDKIFCILKDNKKHKNSIGINNVNLRLKAIFGEQYGLNIESVIGEGTSVHFRIPINMSNIGCEI